MNITCFDHPSYIVEKQYKKTQPTLADSPVVFTNHSRKDTLIWSSMILTYIWNRGMPYISIDNWDYLVNTVMMSVQYPYWYIVSHLSTIDSFLSDTNCTHNPLTIILFYNIIISTIVRQENWSTKSFYSITQSFELS